ncbi:MAG: permease [Alphaproteobacteria bacterium]|nr:permease [Alphaproteobacteria bacterium]
METNHAHGKGSSCCHAPEEKSGHRIDYITWGSLVIIAVTMMLYALNPQWQKLAMFAHAQIDLLTEMSWGVALGLLSVGLMNKIPREYFTAIMGRGDTPGDIVKAAIAGVILDMCNHGILVVAGKLYERGLSTAQVLAFLISSPWNSLSLTFILIALIGLKWTLLFTLASMVIAIISGLVFQVLTKRGVLPENPNTAPLMDGFDIRADARARLKGFKFTKEWFTSVAIDGWRDGKMIVRWILFGAIAAAAIRAFVPTDFVTQWFGPTIVGLLITLGAATIIEICSEGSAPIAAEIINSANAPGNGFAFLMAGVATDYTEILVVREFTKSWKIALFLPLITVPQIIVIGALMN